MSLSSFIWSVADLLRAPILFWNGHFAPVLSSAERKLLRSYVDQGGTILAEACCGNREFDNGFRTMMKSIWL